MMNGMVDDKVGEKRDGGRRRQTGEAEWGGWGIGERIQERPWQRNSPTRGCPFLHRKVSGRKPAS
jgi:hypothetical protein